MAEPTPQQPDPNRIVQGTVARESTMAGQLDSLLGQGANDSALIRQAEEAAKRYANQRGNINTAAAAGDAARRAIDAMMPIAERDAATNFQQQIANQGYTVNADTQAREFQYDSGLLNLQYGETQRQRDFDASQADLDRQFSGEQAGLSRQHETGLLDRNLADSAAQRDFTGQQAALDRAQQANLQQGEQQFQGLQANLDRLQQLAVQSNDVQAQQQLELLRQDFQGREAELGRLFEQAAQERGIAASLGLSEQEYIQELSIQQDAQSFTSDLEAARRQLQQELATQDSQTRLTITDREIAARLGLSEQEFLQAQDLAAQANTFQVQRDQVLHQQQLDTLSADYAARAGLTDQQAALELDRMAAEYAFVSTQSTQEAAQRRQELELQFSHNTQLSDQEAQARLAELSQVHSHTISQIKYDATLREQFAQSDQGRQLELLNQQAAIQETRDRLLNQFDVDADELQRQHEELLTNMDMTTRMLVATNETASRLYANMLDGMIQADLADLSAADKATVRRNLLSHTTNAINSIDVFQSINFSGWGPGLGSGGGAPGGGTPGGDTVTPDFPGGFAGWPEWPDINTDNMPQM